VLEPDDLAYKKLQIRAWRYEPKRPIGTLIYLPGFETHGPMYEAHLDPFWRHRILLPELYRGSHPIGSIEDGINLCMTYFRHKSKELDLSTYLLGGYSVGGLIAAHLAADHGNDHPAPQELLLESPAIPGLGTTMLDFEQGFITMGTRLRFGAEGDSGRIFAREHWVAFVGRALLNYRRNKQLLESINTSEISEGTITIPTRLIASTQDEFFPVERSEAWVRSICATPDITRIARIEGSHARILHSPYEANEIIRTDLRASRKPVGRR